MISLEFLIVTIMLFLNIALLLIKDKNIVYLSFLISIFTYVCSGFYLLVTLDAINSELSIEMLYSIMVMVIASLLILVKGSEKW